MRHFRKERVANLIREIVSEAIAHKLNDPRLEPFTTITRVEVTPDIMVAKIYLSVPGGRTAENKSLMAVQHAAKYVQRLVAKEINIRNCPEIRFEIDQTLKAAQNIMEILDENRKELNKINDRINQESNDLNHDAECIESNDETSSENQHPDHSVES